MELEPTQLARGMDVDIGMGLGDELGGFEGFDSVFAEPTNTTDFFNFCALEETQQQQDAATTSAFGAPLSPVSSFGQQQRAHDFAQESWNAGGGGGQQIQGWPSLTLSKSEPPRNPMMLHGGKPRARKRHDEDEALEAEEAAFPILKRRSSAASMSAGRSPTPEAFEKSHSFSAASSGGWAPAATALQQQQQRRQQGVARHGEHPHPQQGGGMAPLGGAIKVNTDVTSGTVRPPRISVFMSSARRRGGAGLPQSSPALPGGYGGSRQHQLEPTMDRTASAQAQRLKGLRITMRGQGQGQGQSRGVAENYPAVVAMGSPHHPNSTSALLLGDDDAEDQFADATSAPTLRRASSVGALTIAGNGDILSTSPVLSATGTIIQSCELSDRVGGDGGQRRNLVCKVFGSSGSPYMGTANGGR